MFSQQEASKAGWNFYTIEEVCLRVTSGGTPSRRRNDFYIDGTWPWVKTQELIDRHIFETEEYITDDAVRLSSAKPLPTNTVLMAMYGATVGQLGILGRPMTCNQACCAMVVNEEMADHRFLYYLLLNARQRIKSLATGAAQQNLSGQTIKKLGFLFPRLDEQRRIAHILGTLDDKIELNRQMNRTLDEIARTLFRSWFVDFDPVRARMEGRQPEGMDAATAALFPDRLVDSELGLIPEGWEWRPIGEMVTVVGGSTPSTKQPEFWEDGTHLWATPKDLSGLDSPILIETARKITDKGVAQISSRLLPVQSVLLSSRAPVGYLAITTEPTAINQGFIGMICDRGFAEPFILNWTREKMDLIKGSAGGTTFAEISKTGFRPIRGIAPDEAVVAVYSSIVRPLYDLVTCNLRENHSLAEIRDTLLPELLSRRIASHGIRLEETGVGNDRLLRTR